jgi:UDP-2-acetamido-3-amino-2,3-dideoxy-glucuronate N-acetyltransferase
LDGGEGGGMIHPLALVHADCEIGEGTKVWQFASVLRGARIGAQSSIGACSVVDGSRIGARARIGHGAQVHPGVVAGADLFVGPSAVLCNDRWPWREGFDAAALIEGRDVSVICEGRVTIGAGAIVLPGVRLSEGCVIAAGAVCSSDVGGGMVLLRDGQTVPVHVYDGAQRMALAA